MEIKYSNMVAVIYIVMFYGSGIPILYFIAAVYFLVTYWVEKILLLRYYRKPKIQDESLALNMILWFKYALILHLIGGLLMLSNTEILPIRVQD